MKTKLAAAGLVNAILLLAYVWCRLQTYDIGYSITGNLARLQETQEIHSELKLRFSKLASPSRVRTIAETRLGLVPLRADQRVVIEVDRAK